MEEPRGKARKRSVNRYAEKETLGGGRDELQGKKSEKKIIERKIERNS